MIERALSGSYIAVRESAPLKERQGFFTVDEIREGSRVVPMVEAHRHLEASFGYSVIEMISNKFGNLLQPQTLAQIQNIMETPTGKSWLDFINSMPTRWGRLLEVAAGLRRTERKLVRKVAAFFQGINEKKVFKGIVGAGVEKMQAEHIGSLDLIVCPYALTFEGNLTRVPNLDPVKITVSQEHTMLNGWDYKVSSGEIQAKNTLTIREYFRILHSVLSKRKSYDARFGIRREQLEGEFFKNRSLWDPAKKEELERQRQEGLLLIKELFDKGYIRGVDIAGDEGNVAHKLSNFSELHEELEALGVPLSAHVGELGKKIVKRKKQFMSKVLHKKMSKKEQKALRRLAFNNLQTGIEWGLIMAHVPRLFDDSPEMNALLQVALDKGLFYDFNITSNLKLGIARKASKHPVIRAYRREHSMFKKGDPEGDRRFELLINHGTFNTDDPDIFGWYADEPIISELALICKLTNNFGGRFRTVEEMLVHFNMVGQQRKAYMQHMYDQQ